MKQNAVYTVQHNNPLANAVYQMRLAGPTEAFTAPGQFVNLKLAEFYLRRPFSVCDWDDEGFSIIYKVLGRGTAHMAGYAPGTQLNALVGLGNGFQLEGAPQTGGVVLVGGGVGVPPLYALAKGLAAAGTVPTVALGFASAADVFFGQEFAALGCPVQLATEDGTAGRQGLVTTVLEELNYRYYYACGPNAMLAAVWQMGQQKQAEGQLSFEERMGCGFGACMGCSCHTKNGPARVCAEGPVFLSQEVVLP